MNKESYVTSQVMDAYVHDKYLVSLLFFCHYPQNMPFWKKKEEEED